MRQAKGLSLGGRGVLLPAGQAEGITGARTTLWEHFLIGELGPRVVATHCQEHRDGVSTTLGPQQAGAGWNGPLEA